MLQFTFEIITCAKREKKITCHDENPSPPGYQMVHPLSGYVCFHAGVIYFLKKLKSNIGLYLCIMYMKIFLSWMFSIMRNQINIKIQYWDL